MLNSEKETQRDRHSMKINSTGTKKTSWQKIFNKQEVSVTDSCNDLSTLSRLYRAV